MPHVVITDLAKQTCAEEAFEAFVLAFLKWLVEQRGETKTKTCKESIPETKKKEKCLPSLHKKVSCASQCMYFLMANIDSTKWWRWWFFGLVSSGYATLNARWWRSTWEENKSASFSVTVVEYTKGRIVRHSSMHAEKLAISSCNTFFPTSKVWMANQISQITDAHSRAEPLYTGPWKSLWFNNFLTCAVLADVPADSKPMPSKASVKIATLSNRFWKAIMKRLISELIVPLAQNICIGSPNTWLGGNRSRTAGSFQNPWGLKLIPDDFSNCSNLFWMWWLPTDLLR